MKKIIILSVLAFALMSGTCKSSSENGAVKGQTFNLDTTKLKSGQPFYQCTMDPEVISDKPGHCPKCGMELTEIKKQ